MTPRGSPSSGSIREGLPITGREYGSLYDLAQRKICPHFAWLSPSMTQRDAHRYARVTRRGKSTRIIGRFFRPATRAGRRSRSATWPASGPRRATARRASSSAGMTPSRLEQIRRDRIRLIGGQRAGRRERHRATDVVEQRRRVRPVVADRARNLEVAGEVEVALRAADELRIAAACLRRSRRGTTRSSPRTPRRPARRVPLPAGKPRAARRHVDVHRRDLAAAVAASAEGELLRILVAEVVVARVELAARRESATRRPSAWRVRITCSPRTSRCRRQPRATREWS